jgi:hypothetical protein
MKALTLRQPWAWLVIHGPKFIENRRWQPWEPGTPGSSKRGDGRDRSARRVPWRGEFIVHAGAHRPDRDEYLTVINWAEQQMDQIQAAGFEWPQLEDLVTSALIGTAVLENVLPKYDPDAVVDPDAPYQLHNWRMPGQLGWVLGERRALPPKPHPGKRGLWECHWEPQNDGSWRYAPDHYP